MKPVKDSEEIVNTAEQMPLMKFGESYEEGIYENQKRVYKLLKNIRLAKECNLKCIKHEKHSLQMNWKLWNDGKCIF